MNPNTFENTKLNTLDTIFKKQNSTAMMS